MDPLRRPPSPAQVDPLTRRHVLASKEGRQHVIRSISHHRHKEQLNVGFTERFIAQQEVITLAAFITWTVHYINIMQFYSLKEY